MTKISTAEARNEFSEILNRASFGKERIVLTRRGKDLAAVVPMEDLELLERLEDRIDLEDARAALVEVRESGTVTWEKLKSDLGL
jgi:prevent-host-death family protein